MAFDSYGSAAEGAGRGIPVPNNFGATLLLALGFLAAPVLIGVPVLILGLATLRSSDGRPAFPVLAGFLSRFGSMWFRLRRHPWGLG